MMADEALAVLDTILPDYSFSNLQETVFCEVWEGKTYAEIAESCGYEHSYIRDVGFKLWQRLSVALKQKVTKSNVRSVLRRYSRAQLSSLGIYSYHDRIKSSFGNSLYPALVPELDFPSGPVPLNSNLYIERPPIEALTYAEVSKPGSLIHIKGPRQKGKTSLVRRIVAYAKKQGFRTVTLSLHRADSQVFTNLDKFLRWFCANVSRQLGLSLQLDHYWDSDIGSKVSCTTYFEDYLLEEVDRPIVIALDEVNQIFEYPELSRDFLSLLRSWYEDARELEIWQKVRWVIAHATDVYVPLKLNQSPFNVGLAIKLPEFTNEQVLELAERHGLNWVKGDQAMKRLDPLVTMVGRCPSLIRLALYHLSKQDVSLEKLLEEAPTQAGIYSNYLRYYLAALLPHPDLVAAFKEVVMATESVELEALTAYKLESLGLIRIRGNRATASCELYRLFFRNQFVHGIRVSGY
ncbi:AAA-like domain-containing protein [Moorena producens]|uniref:AAA-like domain-containing protein n=1 Tax=Moorena producens TaxID=1155739 RepID=UPI003C77317A